LKGSFQADSTIAIFFRKDKNERCSFKAARKKAASLSDGHFVQMASPRGLVKYHCLSETINLGWKGFEHLLPCSD
jgi:hypothetical protein